ncbi:MAG: amino acid adenylation domain-containing protein, partial [Blastocatellia bacterium]
LGVIVEDLISRPDGRVGDVQMLTVEERHQILVEWNDWESPYSDSSLVSEIFETQADRFFDAVAIEHGDEQLCYRALNDRANGLALHLTDLTATRGECVALCLERGIRMVVAMLGVAKSGAAYLPLDPTWPRERLLALLRDSRARAVITIQKNAELFREFSGPVACITDELGSARFVPDVATFAALGAHLPLYVVYTSGSTGAPKGVCVPHRAVVRLVINSNYVELNSTSWIAQTSPASFDAATFEIWGPLLNGGRVVVIDKETMLSPVRLGQELVTRRIGKMFLTTALFNQLVSESPGIFSGLDTLLFGGEQVDNERVDMLMSGTPPQAVLHVYGPTESTTFASWHQVANEGTDSGSVPIGRPIANTTLHLLDPQLRPAQPGMQGELYIGGDGLASGYLNRPDLTAERFLPDSFAESPGRRLYRTGDIGSFRNDGPIEFAGRADRQVKIRGFRIEPAEIEAALRQFSPLQDAVVAVRQHAPGDHRLIAFVASSEWSPSLQRELRDELGARLPEYMIPSAFVAVQALPLNEHGKVDRKALLELEVQQVPGQDLQVAARTETEEALCWIWAEALGIPLVGVFDDFFELGGHSLLATRVTSRVREFFDVDLPVRDVFECHTVAMLATRVDAAQKDRASQKLPSIAETERGDFPPLSFAQQRLWFLDQIEGCGAAYNVPAVFRAQGELNISALEQSLAEIVRRHEALRTSFPICNGTPFQQVDEQRPEPIHTVDLAGVRSPRAEAAADSLIKNETLRPFDLSAGPLLRTAVLRVSHSEALFLLTVHHIVADGWSVPILLRELRDLYLAFIRGSESSLEELPIQYSDFSAWQRGWLCGEVLGTQLSYWRNLLGEEMASANLPLDSPRPLV